MEQREESETRFVYPESRQRSSLLKGGRGISKNRLIIFKNRLIIFKNRLIISENRLRIILSAYFFLSRTRIYS